MIKGILYYKFENAAVSFGPTLRRWGQKMYRAGMAAQGNMAHEDAPVPSLRCVPISDSKYPKLLSVSISKTISQPLFSPSKTLWLNKNKGVSVYKFINS